MIKTFLCTALLLVASASPAADQPNPCPCVPLSHEWIATACETWNCAMSALIDANGDPYVVAVPNGNPQWKWIVLRRVTAGSAIVSPDAPFTVEQFDGTAEASARFAALDHDSFPTLMSMIDGKMVVVSLRPALIRRHPSAPLK
jgi:hypothetical protein